MVEIFDINISQTIREKKLILKTKMKNLFSDVLIYLLLLSIIVLGLAYLNTLFFRNEESDSIQSIIFILIFILSIYVLYRKTRERIFLKLTTNLGKNQNHNIFIDYAMSEKFDSIGKSKNHAIYTESKSNFILEPKTKFFFIIEENEIYYMVLKKPWHKGNIPTLTEHLYVKSGLKKILKKNQY